MSLTLTLSMRHWELQIGILIQMEYLPVLVRWSSDHERGFLFKFLCFVVRFGADRR